eukprot:TRINITY_DN123832_c0_g1_i1.p1 TRINITY_DN123832_c0_g1~~TRINITY_DN123832_c0_g1_i1.p1  ORF type:complete len:322 (-),score=102.28 TRINITY_DN123832_c0_g1_i1:29-922(-)
MAKNEEVSTDWLRSAGDFCCTVCGRKRLPASEFSRKQVDKMLESYGSIKDRDCRSSADIKQVVFLTGVCRKCTEEKEAEEQAASKAKRDEREAAAAEAVIEAPERVTVTLADRPFGMTPCKAEGVGYLVVKVSEGKPAAKNGVRPGWRVVEVAGKAVATDASLEDAQAVLKAAELPAEVVFEAVPNGADFCTACEKILPSPSFSRKMLTKPREKRRCSNCVEASQEEEAADREAAREAAAPDEAAASQAGKKPSVFAEMRQLCAESAEQAEKVTGLRAVRGGSYGGRGGKAAKGRGR